MVAWLTAVGLWLGPAAGVAQPGWDADSTEAAQQRQAFQLAWEAAARGRHGPLEQARRQSSSYPLWPYLDYEYYRKNIDTVAAAEVLQFLDQHRDYAFEGPLRRRLLRSLGKRQAWSVLSTLEDTGYRDAGIRCDLATARVRTGRTEGLLAQVQSLWLAPDSMPERCDPAFAWLQRQGGITPTLAWSRTELAMTAGNTRLARYLRRFLDDEYRIILDRWLAAAPASESALNKLVDWPDDPTHRTISAAILTALSRQQPERAWRWYQQLDSHFQWDESQRQPILRGIATWGALDLEDDALVRARQIPLALLDDQALAWTARVAMAHGDWPLVQEAVQSMSRDSRDEDRWRYWEIRARAEQGEPVEAMWQSLADSASFHGFLAADELNRDYRICENVPQVDVASKQRVAAEPGLQRALELYRLDIKSFARSEWAAAARRLGPEHGVAVADLAARNDWPDRAIFALADAGALQAYTWRFPVAYEADIQSAASSLNLDPSWIYGVMRAESAMNPRAISPAGAYGLLQVTPPTARRLSARHGLKYRGPQDLLRPEINVPLGTRFMRDLFDDYDDNPILVAGAYNAGPGAVDRWLDQRPRLDPVIWMETLPYFETRDYIPRVLAFATVYSWRLSGDGQPIPTISSRMAVPGERPVASTTRAACPDAAVESTDA